MGLLIGLAGRAGCGKSTVAAHWCGRGFVEYAFANPLKQMLAGLLGVSLTDLERMKRDGVPLLGDFNLDSTIPTVREAMQTLGTEWGRDRIHPDFWLMVAAQRLDWLSKVSGEGRNGVVISDVRFDNEADFIRRRGGVVVHLTRPEADPATPDHRSEQRVSRRQGDFHIVNDNGLEVLLAQADAVLRVITERAAA